MINAQTKQIQFVDTQPKTTTKTGSAEYWQILADIASGKERVYSHEYVMAELRKVLKK